MIKNFNLKKISSFFALTYVSAYASTALASGYHFGTQSVSAQSTANASTAEAADASTIFYNAAGITKLPGTNLSININLVAPSVKYSNAKAYYPGGQPIQGETSGTITDSYTFVPHFYASHQLNDKWSIGLGLYVPFASGTEYQNDSVLRYNVNQMNLTTIDITPVVAYKLNEHHSFAIGLTAQYSTAELRQYANLGRLAGLPNGIDSYAEVKGSDWGFGYTLGYLWDVNDKLRLGLNYRSEVKHTLTGTAKWHPANPAYANPALLGAIRSAGYVEEEDASVKIITPESLSLQGMYKVNPIWTLFGDITWTRHSRFNTLTVNYANPKVSSNATGDTSACANASCSATLAKSTDLQPNWRDTFKGSIGASYQYSKPLQLRFGISYDQSPVKNADYRLSTLPDNDRIWFSVGAKYDINDNNTINLGYSYIYIKDAKANVNGFCGSLDPRGANCVSSRTYGSADFNSYAQMFSAQYNYRF